MMGKRQDLTPFSRGAWGACHENSRCEGKRQDLILMPLESPETEPECSEYVRHYGEGIATS